MAAWYQVAESALEWGSGPTQYPCLAASVKTDGWRLVTCYVYTNDAMRLLTIDGDMATSECAEGRAARNKRRGRNNDFESYIGGMLLAITNLIVETGIATPRRFAQEWSKWRKVMNRGVGQECEKTKIDGIAKALREKLGATYAR